MKAGITDLVRGMRDIRIATVPALLVAVFASGIYAFLEIAGAFGDEIALTGRVLTAEEGLKGGLFNRLAPEGQPLDVARELKDVFRSGESHRLLPDRTLFMIFLDLSTRTRNAFEAGMTQLGGHAHFIDANTSQIAHGESPRDMGIILSSYGHGIAIRHDKVPGEGNAYMRAVAEHARAPVINLQCDEDHPTQQLADLMTIEEKKGKLEGISLAFIGDGNNVSHSLLVAGVLAGLHVRVATPEGFEPDRAEGPCGGRSHDVDLDLSGRRAAEAASGDRGHRVPSYRKESVRPERRRPRFPGGLAPLREIWGGSPAKPDIQEAEIDAALRSRDHRR
jgi:hypothetical protein